MQGFCFYYLLHSYFYNVLNIHHLLKQYWGFDSFRPLQEEIIQSVLDKKDTLALLPTGGGKSVCFQVPALAVDGLCLVVSPLIALMKDQVYNLNKKGIKAVAIYSGIPQLEADILLDNCVFGNVKFLYISPERLTTENFLERLKRLKINLLAVDEAHCISQWGYDFRPPYLKIAEVREYLNNVPVIALTATATPKVVDDIQHKLLFAKPHVLQKSFVRKNLSYVVRQTINKQNALLDILQKVKGSAVVYVRNRKKTKQLSDFLNQNKIKADFYHAGLQPNERSEKQESWIKNKTRVICCTNAFGMGIDKPDVRVVVHMDLAESIEAYFQEAGRAGRDEQKAYAVQLLDNTDIVELDKKISEGYPDINFIREIYNSLCLHFRLAFHSGNNESFDFDINSFTKTFNFAPLKVLQTIKILEQQEILLASDSVYTLSQVKIITDKEVLFKFQASNENIEPLIKFILRTSEGVFENFVNIDEENIAGRLKNSADEIVNQLKLLDKFGIISYAARKNKPQIIFQQNRVKSDALHLNRDFILQRKADFEERLKAMRYYITEATVCRTRLLVKYFGEEIDKDCGVCDVCVARKKTGLSTANFAVLLEKVEKEIKQNALTPEQLNKKLNIKQHELETAMDCLADAGKIARTKEGKLKWNV
jgi:ATP-dependent DNA helicase RecQ